MEVNRREAVAMAAAGTVKAMLPAAEPEMYPEPELLPAFTCSKEEVLRIAEYLDSDTYPPKLTWW